MSTHPLNPYTKNMKTLPPPSALKLPAKRVVVNPYEKKTKKQQQHHLPALPLVSPSPRTLAATVDDRSSNDSVLFLTNSSPQTKQPSSRPPLSPLRSSVRKAEPEDRGNNKRQCLMDPDCLIGTNIIRRPLDFSNVNKENICRSKENANDVQAASSKENDKILDGGVAKGPSNSISISVFLVHAGGLYCRLCEKGVGRAYETIRRHLKEHHPTALDGTKFTNLHSRLMAAKGRVSESSVTTPVVTDSPILTRFKCSVCKKSYSSKFNFNKHVRGSGGRCERSLCLSTRYTKSPFGTLVECPQSNTGTRTPLLSSNFLMSNIEAPRPFEKIGNVIAAYVRDDEDADTFISLLGPLMETGTTFQSIISGYIEKYGASPAPQELQLSALLEMGEHWLLRRARHEVSLVPGNYRAALLQFDANDMGEVSQNLVYNFRHREQTLLPELRNLLCFLWRSDLPCLLPFRRSFRAGDPFLVVNLLATVFHEQPESAFHHPSIIKYTLSRFFRKSHDDSLFMVGAGQNASTAAAILSLMRSIVCSLVCSARCNFDDFAQRVVRKSQLCRTANILAPIIRRLREMERRKKKKRMVTVDDTGLIAVDGFEIVRDDWSHLIPTIASRCESILSSLLSRDDWRTVLDPTTQLFVESDFTFEHASGDGVRSAVQLELRSPVDFSLIDELCSYIELSFHGLGLGSLRYIELERMERSRCVWHRSTIYFDIFSEKVYSHKTKSRVESGNSIEHKIPITIARIYLIYLQLTKSITCYSSLSAVPKRKSTKHSMCHAAATIFGFSEIPDAVQVRHFWTSILNYLFPSGDLTGALYADSEIAESSGHAARTHQVKYSSLLAGGREYLYRTLHTALGEKLLNNGSDSTAPVRPMDLLSSLKMLFGPNAGYTSTSQQQLVEFSASADSGHGHADLPCGSGKSMAWILPIAASFISGRRGPAKCTIVVLPYKFLSAFQTEAASQFLDKTVDSWIVTLNASNFQGSSVPDELMVNKVIPDLLFLTIDALDAFMTNQRPLLARLCCEGSISRIVVDEIHTLLTEDFRPAYQCLRQLPSFGIPILTMSGSLPCEFRSSLLSYIGMTTDGMSESVPSYEPEIITGGDVLGHFPRDFEFGCTVLANPRETSYRSAMAIVEKHPDHCLHIMAASKSDAAYISSKLTTVSIDNRLLTSDIHVDDQTAIARAWREGSFTVLVSTSIAMVGNENNQCRHLILVGYLFNAINMVQAINRLRPKQRYGGASIQIFLPRCNPTFLDKVLAQDRLRFEALAERGLVPNDSDLWDKFGSIEGLHQWLVLEEGCWISNLCRHFGTIRDQCNICDRCKGVSNHSIANASTRTLRQENTTMNIAMNVIRKMQSQCIVCLSDYCDGEGCLPRRSCFACGGDHYRKECRVNWNRVLVGKGCFYCLDIFGRQDYQSHQSNKGNGCPLKRRLKRLVIDRFAVSSHSSIETYYSRIAAEKSTFYSFLASTAPSSPVDLTTTLHAEQLDDSHDSTPLLRPDCYCNRDLRNENNGPVEFHDTEEALSIYKFLSNEPKSSRRKRGFVYGALYKNLIGNDHALIDCRGTGRIEMNVDIAGKRESTMVTVVDCSDCSDLLDSVSKLGETLGSTGNSRRDVGDVGEMWGLGYRNKSKRELYKKTTDKIVKKAMPAVCENAVKEFGKRMPKALESIREAESKGTWCPPLTEMGGANGPGSSIMISKNLGNSAHYDFRDMSMSVGVWVEERKDTATNWYFIMPNVRLNGKLGVVIQLFHGCVISWNGRLIKHCTSVTSTGDNNNVYGCMFGSCRP